ncbi:MAG: HDOD domain-containing protein [Sandaracinaceae bacterium]
MLTLTEDPVEAEWFGGRGDLRLRPDAVRSVAAAAAQAVGVKVFPAVARHVMSLLADERCTIRSLRVAIEQDPGLAGRLLRVANCAAYTRGTACRSIDDAVLRLGYRQVRGIVAGITAFGMFPTACPVGHAVRAHSAGVAAILGVLGRAWRTGDAGDLFLVGLLHDLGKLAGLQVGEFPYNDLEDDDLRAPDRVHVWERARAGYDHAALGAAVLHGWRFDSVVVRTVAAHHDPGLAYAEDGGVGLGVALLRLAEAIEYQLHRGPELDADFLDEVGRSGECSYAGFSREVLYGMWPRLAACHHELQAALID